jgi:hypothetical protein
MKTFFIIVVVLLVLGMLTIGVVCFGVCGGVGYFVYSTKKELDKEADNFLKLVGEGKFEEAYQSTAAAFRQAESVQSFTKKMQEYGLDGYQSGEWSGFTIDDNVATLNGTVTTKTGVRSVKLTFTREGERWRIVRIDVMSGGIAVNDPPKIPNIEEQFRLVKDSLRMFQQAVREESFVSFYGQVSKQWQKQTSVGELENAFKVFFPHKDEFRRWEKALPIFDVPAQLEDNQVLRLKGLLPDPMGALQFDLKFVFEDGEWKLLGMSINMKTDRREG